MSPLVAFFLGVGLMCLTNGFLIWSGWKWLTNAGNACHMVVGLYGSLQLKSKGIEVHDAHGNSRFVTWHALRDSTLRAIKRLDGEKGLEDEFL